MWDSNDLTTRLKRFPKQDSRQLYSVNAQPLRNSPSVSKSTKWWAAKGQNIISRWSAPFRRSRCVITAPWLCRFISLLLFFRCVWVTELLPPLSQHSQFYYQKHLRWHMLQRPRSEELLRMWFVDTHIVGERQFHYALLFFPLFFIEVPSASLITRGDVHFCFIYPRSSNGSYNGEHRLCQQTAVGVGLAVRKAIRHWEKKKALRCLCVWGYIG